MQWSPIQEQALDSVGRWLAKGGDRPFILSGYAGTGKTTLAIHLAQGAGHVLFAAYTGKAAHVMRQRGCPGATTIHSLVYKPKERSKQKLRDLQDEVDQLWVDHIGNYSVEERLEQKCKDDFEQNHVVCRLRFEIRQQQENLKRPSFSLNTESELKDADLLVIDECSMVDEEMANDILSFGTPLLVLGDPAQLPPVKGTGYFTKRDPDVLLTEIHRQAADNPIIQMATRVREGEQLEPGQYGESRIITMAQGTPEMWLGHDQVLCGREKNNGSDVIFRQNLNRRIRKVLGRDSVYPVPGDKLVCLKNNHDLGLLNGGLWETLDAQDLGDTVGLTVKNDQNVEQTVEAHGKIFKGEELEYWEVRDHESFDYGYAMTVHKAQGSQWDSVLLFNQSKIFRQDWRKWLYTGLTRAAQRITIVNC